MQGGIDLPSIVPRCGTTDVFKTLSEVESRRTPKIPLNST
jgi:hypothetical protein